MASNEIFKTRAGILPSVEELPYHITTTEVKDYLQRKLNVVVNAMRQNHLYNGEDVNIELVTVEMGTNFVPFTVVLPMSVLKDTKKQRPTGELSVFNQKDNDHTVNLHDQIMKMFLSYTFDKSDGEAFYSSVWRRECGVPQSKSAFLKHSRLPNVIKLNNGNMERVTFLIDPVRVFHDMLVMESNPSDFRIEIEGWKKIRSGEFRYKMTRKINKHNGKKGGRNIADEINRKVNGYNK